MIRYAILTLLWTLAGVALPCLLLHYLCPDVPAVLIFPALMTANIIGFLEPSFNKLPKPQENDTP